MRLRRGIEDRSKSGLLLTSLASPAWAEKENSAGARFCSDSSATPGPSQPSSSNKAVLRDGFHISPYLPIVNPQENCASYGTDERIEVGCLEKVAEEDLRRRSGEDQMENKSNRRGPQPISSFNRILEFAARDPERSYELDRSHDERGKDS